MCSDTPVFNMHLTLDM